MPKEKSKYKKWRYAIKFIIAGILLLAGLITAITAWTIDNKTQQMRHIENIIREKMTWGIKINDLITNIRATRVYIQLKCKYKQPMSAYEQDLERSRARIQLIKATIDAKTILAQPTLAAIRHLIKADEGVSNVCSNSVSDRQWHHYQMQIDQLLSQSIKKNQNQLSDIRQSMHWLRLFKKSGTTLLQQTQSGAL